jgi:hypothetical protein
MIAGTAVSVAAVIISALHDLKYVCFGTCPVARAPSLFGIETAYLLLSISIVAIFTSWGCLYLKQPKVAVILSFLPFLIFLFYVLST